MRAKRKPISKSLEIRRFVPTDQEAVWSLHRLALAGAEADVGGDFFSDSRDIERAYLEPDGEFLMGVLDGALIAMGGFVPLSPERVEIKRMRVHPSFQRQGFGRDLLEALEIHARKRGCRTIYIETTIGQTAAQRLYAVNGYQETGRDLKLGLQVIRYEKSFPPD